MKKDKSASKSPLFKTIESQSGKGFQGMMADAKRVTSTSSRTTNTPTSLSVESDPKSHELEGPKQGVDARLIGLTQLPYDNRVTVKQLRAIWNDDEETYTDDDLLFIRDWLYTMSEIIIDVVNTPGFVPPVISETEQYE